MHHVCPMVPGSSQRLKLPLPADLSMTDQTDDDMDDERFILAAKRARSASMKEGMYEETAPPSLLAQLSQNTPPSSLELSLMLAQARAAQERAAQEHVRRQLQDQSPGSPPGLPPGLNFAHFVHILVSLTYNLCSSFEL